MTCGSWARPTGEKWLLHFVQQAQPLVPAIGRNGRVQVFHTERSALSAAAAPDAIAGNNERCMTRSKETGGYRRLSERAADAHKSRQVGMLVGQFVGNERA